MLVYKAVINIYIKNVFSPFHKVSFFPFIARLKRLHKRTNLQRFTWMEGQSNEYNPKWHNAYNWYLARIYLLAFVYRCPLCPRIAFQANEATLKTGLRHRMVLLPNIVGFWNNNIYLFNYILVSVWTHECIFNPLD